MAGHWKSLNSGRDKLHGQIDRHQVSQSSHSTDLAGQPAVWTHLKEVMRAFSFAFEATQFVEMEDATFLCVPYDLVYGHRSFKEKKRFI